MGGFGRALVGLAVKLTELVRELNYWQRRSAILALAPDRHLPHPERAPETFSEFLARTSGPLLREPSCKARLAGRLVG
ncbi:MAG TPA: hypothetical protein VHJ18_13680 [Streptosporangiaceae bacterium]|jgi:hypothetical protein|nr:hypothetical protein [Streptosporangiaceae bacterium]